MVRTEEAKRRAEDIMTVIRDVQAQGAVSIRQIAAGLNRLGVKTSRGGEWSTVQVQRVLTS